MSNTVFELIQVGVLLLYQSILRTGSPLSLNMTNRSALFMSHCSIRANTFFGSDLQTLFL